MLQYYSMENKENIAGDSTDIYKPPAIRKNFDTVPHIFHCLL
uniref:Uncharacterized protein n=1 Tax=Anguilla anguilla TaxID=7936 RepID=A0A0E9PM88_ANGAN